MTEAMEALGNDTSTWLGHLEEIYNQTSPDNCKYWLAADLPFEASFDQHAHARWMRDHWHYAVWAAVIYVVLIFGGQRWMQNRPAYSLRKPLEVSFALQH